MFTLSNIYIQATNNYKLAFLSKCKQLISISKTFGRLRCGFSVPVYSDALRTDDLSSWPIELLVASKDNSPFLLLSCNCFVFVSILLLIFEGCLQRLVGSFNVFFFYFFLTFFPFHSHPQIFINKFMHTRKYTYVTCTIQTASFFLWVFCFNIVHQKTVLTHIVQPGHHRAHNNCCSRSLRIFKLISETVKVVFEKHKNYWKSSLSISVNTCTWTCTESCNKNNTIGHVLVKIS